MSRMKKLSLTLAAAGIFAVNIAGGFVNPTTSEAASYNVSLSMSTQDFAAAPATNIPDIEIPNDYFVSRSMASQGFIAALATDIPDVQPQKTHGSYFVSRSMSSQGFVPVLATNIPDSEPEEFPGN